MSPRAAKHQVPKQPGWTMLHRALLSLCIPTGTDQRQGWRNPHASGMACIHLCCRRRWGVSQLQGSCPGRLKRGRGKAGRNIACAQTRARVLNQLCQKLTASVRPQLQGKPPCPAAASSAPEVPTLRRRGQSRQAWTRPHGYIYIVNPDLWEPDLWTPCFDACTCRPPTAL